MIYTVTLNPSIDRTMHFAKLTIGELNRAAHSRLDLSGKGVNVSVALRRFGVETMALGIAAGNTGRALVDGLTAQGYACEFIWVAGETRSNVTVIDESTGVTTKLNEPGPHVTECDLSAFEALLLSRLQPGDLVVMSGSLPPGAPAETYARLIGAARQRGAFAALDTSGASLAPGCAAGPDFVKPNAIEAMELVGCPFDTPAQWVEGLKAILALGPKRVLLSLGSQGATLAVGDPAQPAIWHAQPPRIQEISAVGAGDASLSGALWAWRQGLPPEELVRWGVATGTATAMVDGSAMPTLDAIRAVYEQVRVTRLA